MSRKSKKNAPPGKITAIQSSPADLKDRWTVFGVCIFLAAIVWTVFGQTLRFGFVNYDDNDYVYQNPVVQNGLTFKGIVWAFTHDYAANWHPVTWISHMLDCQFYGLNAGGHHLTNVLLHTAASILLFLALRQMTGFLWRSALVAAVFAIHPLRVESVAWVAERKDVLSGMFFMLTLCAYVRYARGPWSAARYGLVMLMFALGLMSKPMLVTLPLVLLLLDYWPLNRWQVDATTQPVFRLGGWRVPRRVILEKLPLFGLVVASCAATLYAQTEAIQSFDEVSLPLRVGNALIAYVTYVGQMFWPSGLAVLYPLPVKGWPLWEVVMASFLLLLISGGVFVLRKSRPYLVVGWLWYLVMLVPVIGIVQVGGQARADRYTYLPQIGLYVLLVWAAADLCVGWRHRRMLLGGGSAVILAALILCARAQTAYWRDSETLWTHTLACTSDNFTAHLSLGNTLLAKGRVDEAIAHYQQALQINPDYAGTHNNLGNALLQKGDVDEAIAHYQKALQIDPGYADAHNNLGRALFQKGDLADAIAHLQQALQIDPGNADAHNNLGNALLHKGDLDGAIAHYQQALQINPGYAEAHNNLANALLQKGDLDGAIAHYQAAVQIKPDYAEAHYNLGNALFQKGKIAEAIAQFQEVLQINPDQVGTQINLAWVLATCPQATLRNGNQAVELAQRANQLTGEGNPVFLGTLAAAYAEAGRFPEAVETAQRALQLAGAQSDTAQVNALQLQMKLYQAGLPYHSH